VLGVALVLLVPLATRLSPFPDIDVDPAWSFARSWAYPVGLLGASLALAFLSRQAAVLDGLAPRTRWAGEVGSLLGGVGSLQACLVAGALVSSPGAVGELAPLLPDLLLSDLHLVAVGALVLRLATPVPVRLAVLWVLLWGLPVLTAGTSVSPLLDAGRFLRESESLSSGPRAGLSALAISTGLLLVGFLLTPPRTLSRPR